MTSSTSVAGDVPAAVVAGDLVYRTPPAQSFVQAEGVRLRDAAGKEYLDGEAANGTVSLGYDPSILLEAAAKTATLPALPSFCESELRLRVLEKIAQRLDTAVGVKGRIAVEL